MERPYDSRKLSSAGDIVTINITRSVRPCPPHLSTDPNPHLQSINGHAFHLPRPGSVVEYRGYGFATTPATSRRYSREPSPECNLTIIMEDPPNSKSYREKLIRTDEERAQQKEDGRRLKEIGGACIACYQSKKKCGLGNPCPLCKRSGKECVRKYPGSSSPSPSRSGSAQPSTPESFGEGCSHLKLPSKDNPADLPFFPVPLDNLSTMDPSIPSVQWGQWMTSNDDLGRISPLGFTLDGAFEENDFGDYSPQFEQLFRATYDA
ncbi:hypothetical protein N7481_005551 [Penicillium waksmanii]|uniref:uncharacterized protein n=1 Tax=Penicillium waksmanii TaxID=69791 RepID=UPI002546694E|nr:uncharacterized protein N7481_005551 [Penicillium waksmanii]KAJ5983452.1 hypothetical protein N7481_005551 [Penicillium waksmanii]